MEGNALRCPLLGKVFAALKYQESRTRCQNCKHLTLAVRQRVSQSTQLFLVCVWIYGYCRRLLTKFAIPMVKVQLLEQDLLTSSLPVDHYQHSVNYIDCFFYFNQPNHNKSFTDISTTILWPSSEYTLSKSLRLRAK